jgi:hypothetical protein
MSASWSVLLYMTASPRLAPYAKAAIAELCSAPRNPRLSIAVQLDGRGRKKPTRYRIVERKAVVSPPSSWTYRPRRALRDFVDWGLAPDATSRAALVLWGEGGGWIYPAGLYEGASHGPLDAELTAAIGGTKRGRVDVLGFDACLMSMVEVVYGARELCGFQVASETFVPLTGWPYRPMVQLLETSPPLPPRAWAEKMVRCIETRPRHGTTLATFASSRADALAASFAALARELSKLPASRHAELARARAEMLHVGNPFFVDVLSMLRSVERCVKEHAVVVAVTKVRRDVERACLARDAVGADNRGMSGLSIFFPQTKTPYLESYQALAFAKKTGWGAFLTKYHARA